MKETVLQINLKALTQNFNYLVSKLSPKTKFLAVVKAFAYGSDAVVVAKHLQSLGADYFAVAYTHEGVQLRRAGISKPILVLHPQIVNFKTLIDYHLEPSIYSIKVLNYFILVAEKEHQSHYPVHITFNTGLNRLGFSKTEIAIISSQIKTTTSIRVTSVFSHLAASEDLNEKDFTLKQMQRFEDASALFETKIGYKPWRHLCNTSGLINYPEAHYDMVRCGIGLYGFGNSKCVDAKLQPVATLRSIISQIHLINPGETVGYNRAFLATDFQKTATIPIGHADGIGRHLGNGRGYVQINGQQAPIIGNVCMDMIMVNVTLIDCKVGDTVVIFDGEYPATALAEATETISYEILTNVSQRVKREVLS